MLKSVDHSAVAKMFVLLTFGDALIRLSSSFEAGRKALTSAAMILVSANAITLLIAKQEESVRN